MFFICPQIYKKSKTKQSNHHKNNANVDILYQFRRLKVFEFRNFVYLCHR